MSEGYQAPVVGALYASRDDDGRYRIMKVLALDASAVHIRIYADRFEQLPTQVTSSELSLGSLGGPEFGIGHVPVNAKGFGVGLTVVGLEEVREEELDGYRIWAGLDPI